MFVMPQRNTLFEPAFSSPDFVANLRTCTKRVTLTGTVIAEIPVRKDMYAPTTNFDKEVEAE